MNNLKIENVLKTLAILYIENDKKFFLKLTEALELKSKILYHATNVKDAVTIYNEHKIDIIITEVFKEDKSGIKFIKKIRQINDTIPIIVISNSIIKEDLISLIPLYLTNFIPKPIDLVELKKSLYDCVNTIIKFGHYEINFRNDAIYNVNKKTLMKDNQDIELTCYEIFFLDALISNRHNVLSQEVYKGMIWKDQFGVSDSAFKSLLNRLRSKIGKDTIKNTSGFGYRLNL